MKLPFALTVQSDAREGRRTQRATAMSNPLTKGSAAAWKHMETAMANGHPQDCCLLERHECEALLAERAQSPEPRGEWPTELEAARRVGAMALGAAGQHAERVLELEAEVSTLREHLAEVNRLLGLHIAKVTELEARWEFCSEKGFPVQDPNHGPTKGRWIIGVDDLEYFTGDSATEVVTAAMAHKQPETKGDGA